MVGKLPDGTALSKSLVGIRDDLDGVVGIPIYHRSKGKVVSTLTGELVVQESAVESVPDLEGSVEWVRPEDASRKLLPQAFSCILTFTGYRWSAPNSINILTGTVDSSEFTLVLDADSRVLDSPVSKSGIWPVSNKPTFSEPSADITFAVKPKTGVFSGKVILPALDGGKPKSAKYTGLLLSSPVEALDTTLLHGAGFFLGPNAPAPVEIQSN